MRYIMSKLVGRDEDGFAIYDHTEVKAMYNQGRPIEERIELTWWQTYYPHFGSENIQFRAVIYGENQPPLPKTEIDVLKEKIEKLEAQIEILKNNPVTIRQMTLWESLGE